MYMYSNTHHVGAPTCVSDSKCTCGYRSLHVQQYSYSIHYITCVHAYMCTGRSSCTYMYTYTMHVGVLPVLTCIGATCHYVITWNILYQFLFFFHSNFSFSFLLHKGLGIAATKKLWTLNLKSRGGLLHLRRKS